MPARGELGREAVHDSLGAAIRDRRHALEGRRDLGDPKLAWRRGHRGTREFVVVPTGSLLQRRPGQARARRHRA